MDEEIKSLAIKIAIDSGSATAGINNLKKQMSVIDSTFKSSVAGVKNWGASLDGLKANAQALGDKISLQKQIVSGYSDQLKKSQDTLDKNAQKMMDIKVKLESAKQAYDQSAASIGKNDEATKKLKADVETLTKQYNSAESLVRKNDASVKGYTIQLNNAKGSLNLMNSELEQNNAKIQKVETQTKKLGMTTEEFTKKSQKMVEKLDNVGSKLSDVGGKMTLGITAPIAAAGVASFKLASDMNESINKVDVAFKNNAKDIENWSKTTLEKYGLAQGSSLDMAATFGDMATSMGFSTNKAADMSKTIVGLAADMSSFKNIPIAESQTALTAIFTGETESLKKLGIVMTENALQNYADAQGIKEKVSEMSEQEKVQLRYNYILSVTKNAQGDFARTSDSAANQTRMFKEQLKQTGETFGQEIVPAITPAIKALNSLLKSFGSLSDGTKQFIVVGGLAVALAGPAVVGAGKVFTAVGAIKKALDGMKVAQVSATAATAATGTASTAAATGITAAGTAAEGTTVAAAGMGAAFAAALIPIGLFAAAIAGTIYLQNEAKKEIEEHVKAIAAKYDALKKKSDEYYESEIMKLNKEQSDIQDASYKKISAINKLYDEKEKAISKDLKAQKKALDEENDAYKKSYDERVKLIEDEAKKKLAFLDADTAVKTIGIQAQIDAIDAQNEADDKARTAKENKEKEAELRYNIAHAKTIDDRQNAQKELDTFLGNLNYQRVQDERNTQKKLLQSQIETINTEAQQKKQAITDEEAAQKTAAETLYSTQKQSVDDRLSALDNYVEQAKEKYEADKENAITKAQETTDALVDEYNNRINKLQQAQKAADAVIDAGKEAAKIAQEAADKARQAKEANDAYRKAGGNAMAAAMTATDQSHMVDMPKKAIGDRDWRGGWVNVSEEGGEILNLPQHTQIIPHDISMEMARSARNASPQVTTNIYPVQLTVPITLQDGSTVTATIDITAQQLKLFSVDKNGA